jgi:hypothetical protein
VNERSVRQSKTGVRVGRSTPSRTTSRWRRLGKRRGGESPQPVRPHVRVTRGISVRLVDQPLNCLQAGRLRLRRQSAPVMWWQPLEVRAQDHLLASSRDGDRWGYTRDLKRRLLYHVWIIASVFPDNPAFTSLGRAGNRRYEPTTCGANFTRKLTTDLRGDHGSSTVQGSKMLKLLPLVCGAVLGNQSSLHFGLGCRIICLIFRQGRSSKAMDTSRNWTQHKEYRRPNLH